MRPPATNNSQTCCGETQQGSALPYRSVGPHFILKLIIPNHCSSMDGFQDQPLLGQTGPVGLPVSPHLTLSFHPGLPWPSRPSPRPSAPSWGTPRAFPPLAPLLPPPEETDRHPRGLGSPHRAFQRPKAPHQRDIVREGGFSVQVRAGCTASNQFLCLHGFEGPVGLRTERLGSVKYQVIN